jgi:hypothetical protein
MGNRTLIIDRKNTNEFDCYYAQWGIKADPITQSRPLGTGWNAETVLDAIDATIEALIVRNRSSYCVCWLDPTLSDPDDIAIARTDDVDLLRSWWTEIKSRAIGAVADGHTPERVREALLTALTGRAESVYVDDASFLFADG